MESAQSRRPPGARQDANQNNRETHDAVIVFKGYTFDDLRRTVRGEGFETIKLAPRPALVFAAIINTKCQLVTDGIIEVKV